MVWLAWILLYVDKSSFELAKVLLPYLCLSQMLGLQACSTVWLCVRFLQCCLTSHRFSASPYSVI